MKPNPFEVTSDNSIRFSTGVGKPWKIMKFEEVSDKELLFRQVMLSQSIRSMMIYFVIIASISIISSVAILLTNV